MEKIKIELGEGEELLDDNHPSVLERISFGILFLLSFLLPIFFVPSLSAPFQFSKMMLLSVAVLVAFALWLVARLKDGRFVLPNTSLLPAAGVVLLVAFVSGLFSGALRTAFIGQALDVGTVSATLIMTLLLFLIPIVYRSKDKIFYSYLAFFVAFFLIAFFHLLRLIFGPALFSMGLFTDITANVIGKWNDLGIFFGLGGLLSLVTLELISLSRVFKIIAYAALLISLFSLALINFPTIWYVLALFSLIFLVYIISFDTSESRRPATEYQISETFPAESRPGRRIPSTSLSVLLVSLVFILGSGPIGNYISNKFGVNQLEVRPSWSATFLVAKDALVKDPILGVGPNRFVNEWLLSKPDGINGTVFWNTDFNVGIGLVPSYLVTTGILGILSWIIFLGLFVYLGFKAILSAQSDQVGRYLLSSSFLAALFLWIFNVFYIPSLAIVALTYIFTGLFLAALYQEKIVKSRVITFVNDPRKGFISVLGLILLLIGTVATGYLFVQKYIAAVDFQNGVLAFNTEGNVDKAEAAIVKAVSFDSSNSVFYRFLAEIDLMRMNALLSQNTKNVSPDALRSQFQSLLGAALQNARQATTIDSTDYQNWLELGRVYEAVVPLKIPNAYESAASAYGQAFTLNPKGPAILLTLARLETTHSDTAKAKNYIMQALQQKNNYTEAIFLLAQIQIQEGNLKDAISSVEAAALLSPNDSSVFFQLGLLRYSNKDFPGAVSALEQAVALNSQYANAKYFLGLSYDQVGRIQDAIRQFQDLKTTNPDNKEIDLILRNLNAGRPPFANATPPIDSQPQNRAKLPVSEKGSKKRTAPVDTVTSDPNASPDPAVDPNL